MVSVTFAGERMPRVRCILANGIGYLSVIIRMTLNLVPQVHFHCKVQLDLRGLAKDILNVVVLFRLVKIDKRRKVHISSEDIALDEPRNLLQPMCHLLMRWNVEHGIQFFQTASFGFWHD